MTLAHNLTFDELDEASARVAGLLKAQGIEPGERVGIMLPEGTQSAIIADGALRAGCVVVPLDLSFTEREVAFHLGDSQARMVFAWHEYAPAAGPGATAAGSICKLVDSNTFGGA